MTQPHGTVGTVLTLGLIPASCLVLPTPRQDVRPPASSTKCPSLGVFWESPRLRGPYPWLCVRRPPQRNLFSQPNTELTLTKATAPHPGSLLRSRPTRSHTLGDDRAPATLTDPVWVRFRSGLPSPESRKPAPRTLASVLTPSPDSPGTSASSVRVNPPDRVWDTQPPGHLRDPQLTRPRGTPAPRPAAAPRPLHVARSLLSPVTPRPPPHKADRRACPCPALPRQVCALPAVVLACHPALTSSPLASCPWMSPHRTRTSDERTQCNHILPTPDTLGGSSPLSGNSQAPPPARAQASPPPALPASPGPSSARAGLPATLHLAHPLPCCQPALGSPRAPSRTAPRLPARVLGASTGSRSNGVHVASMPAPPWPGRQELPRLLTPGPRRLKRSPARSPRPRKAV